MGFDVSKIVKAVETFVNGKDSEANNNAIDTGAEKKFASIFYGKIINAAVNRGELSKDEANKIFGLELSKPRRAEGTGGEGDGGNGTGTGGVGNGGDIDWSNAVVINFNIENNWYINVNISTQTQEIVDKLINAFMNAMADMSTNITGAINDFKAELVSYLQESQENMKEFVLDLFNKVDKNSKLQLEALQEIIASLENAGIHIEGIEKAINDLLKVQIEAVKTMDVKLDTLINLVQENNQDTKAQNKMLALIYDAITKLSSNFENFTEVQQEQLNKVLAMLDSNKASYAQIIALLQAIKSDTSENCENSKKIIEAINNGKTEILEALAKLDANFTKYGDTITAQLRNILVKIGANTNPDNPGGGTDLSAIVDLMQKMLEKLDNIDKNTGDTNKYLDKVVSLLTKFDAKFTESITNIVNKMGDDSAKLDKLIALLQKLDEHNTEQNEAILAAIEAIGVSVGDIYDICEENNVEQKTTNDLLKNLTNLISNIQVSGGTGGTVDFSAVIKAIKESASTINSSIINLANMTKTINESLNAFAEQNHKDLTKLQQLSQTIIELLGNLPDGTDINKIMEVLNKMFVSITNIEQKENTIIVHCCCGGVGESDKPHEGELSDLNDLLGAKGIQFVADDTTGVSNPTVGGNRAGKFVQDGQVFIRREDGRVFDMSGRERPDIK